jgi:hypothetical protein
MKKKLASALLAATCLSFAPTIAHAIPLDFGSKLNITGGNDLNFTNQTITFNFANPFNVAANTGSFVALGTGGSIQLIGGGAPVNWNTLTTNNSLGCGVGCIYTGTNNGLTVSFNLLTESVSANNGFLDISGTGLISLTGFTPTQGTFFLSSQGGTATRLSFSTTTTAVPGPVVGAGLPGLLAAGLALLALARRRRARFG